MRRVATAALSLPMWIVMILTGGEWCLMPGAHVALEGPTATVTRAHAMPADIGEHAAHLANAGEADAARGGAAAPHHGAHGDATTAPVGGSTHHGADGGACGSRAMCGVAVAPTARLLVARASRPPMRPVIVAVDRPASVTFAPEIPPPRA